MCSTQTRKAASLLPIKVRTHFSLHILGWPKFRSDFCITLYGKTQTNFWPAQYDKWFSNSFQRLQDCICCIIIVMNHTEYFFHKESYIHINGLMCYEASILYFIIYKRNMIWLTVRPSVQYHSTLNGVSTVLPFLFAFIKKSKHFTIWFT